MNSQFRSLLAAISFLTRIPVPSSHNAGDLATTAVWFPVVGLIVGAVAASVFAASSFVWPSLLAIVLSTIVTVRLTGAFHEDALADSLDGFGGGWNREQVLTIMKDSRVGSYALVGMILVMLAKVSALQSIVDASSGLRTIVIRDVAAALIAAHVVARCSSVWMMAALPYVQRTDNSRASAGGPFAGAVTGRQAVVATFMTMAVVVPATGLRSVGIFGAAALVTVIAGRYFISRIGGITGDALGAANQAVELATYLVLAARVQT